MRSPRTLDTPIERYLEQRRRRGEINAESRTNMRSHLLRLSDSFGHRPVEHLTMKAIERWLETIGDRAPATRRTNLSTVNGFCEWLVRERIIARNPCVDIAPIRVPRATPRAMPADDIAMLIGACRDERARAIVELGVGMGLRCIEISRARTSDYDERGATLTVTGKGGHERTLPVPATVAAAIAAYWRVEGYRGGALIRNRTTNDHLSAKTISIYVRKWMRAAGVKERAWDGRGAHSLRHTAASDVLERVHDGTGILVVQEMLGHVRLETTARYVRRITLGQLREAMEGRDYAAEPAPPSPAVRFTGEDGWQLVGTADCRT